jgi:hypothetical protein
MSTAQSDGIALRTDGLGALHYVGILAALVTAGVHFRLGFGMFPSGLGISFILAGLGFVGAVVLVLIGFRRRTVYQIGIPFTLIQIVLWYYLNFAAGSKSFPGDVGTLGAVDKAAQVVLLVVLAALLGE